MTQKQHNRTSVNLHAIKIFLLIILYSSLMPTCLLKTKTVHAKRFVIHVPMKIRTHHHTHTVYTQVHGVGKESNSDGGGRGGKASKQTIYKIMGYSTHHTGLAAGGGGGNKVLHHRHRGHNSHGYRHNRGIDSSGCDEINYDDYTNYDNSLPKTSGHGGGGVGGSGDMIFNHFSRQDEEDYPVVEEVIDDEMGDEWE